MFFVRMFVIFPLIAAVSGVVLSSIAVAEEHAAKADIHSGSLEDVARLLTQVGARAKSYDAAIQRNVNSFMLNAIGGQRDEGVEIKRYLSRSPWSGQSTAREIVAFYATSGDGVSNPLRALTIQRDSQFPYIASHIDQPAQQSLAHRLMFFPTGIMEIIATHRYRQHPHVRSGKRSTFNQDASSDPGTTLVALTANDTVRSARIRVNGAQWVTFPRPVEAIQVWRQLRSQNNVQTARRVVEPHTR